MVSKIALMGKKKTEVTYFLFSFLTSLARGFIFEASKVHLQPSDLEFCFYLNPRALEQDLNTQSNNIKWQWFIDSAHINIQISYLWHPTELCDNPREFKVFWVVVADLIWGCIVALWCALHLLSKKKKEKEKKQKK